MRRGLTARIVGASGALALVVSAILVVLLIAIGNLRDAERQAARSDSALAAAADLKSLLLDLETGQRGFIITRRKSFLAPWKSARAALPARERRFVALARDDPRQRRAAQAIVGAVEAYVHRFSVPLVNLARIDVRGATAVVVAAEARERPVDVPRLGAFAAAETRLAATKRAGARTEARRATAIGIGGAVGILALIALFMLYLRSIVVEPVRRVAAAAGRLAEGDLTARVKRTEEGDEVADLGQTFNAMAVSLQFSREELTRQNEELERQRTDLANALRLKDELFALVSHELRTPLTSVIGYLELVMDDGHAPLDPEQRRHLEVVERNAKRLLRLVGDLLFAAQAEAGQITLEPRPVDLSVLVRETVEAARPGAEECGLELDVELAAQPALLADRDRLGQVLDNLVSNAIKFTPREGRVTIRLCAGEESAVLEVIDTGVGIPAAEIESVFERFFRASTATSRAIPGVGLGLTVVKAIVEAHQGRIAVRRGPHGGTCFRVELPLAAPVADGRTERAAGNAPYAGSAAGSRAGR